MNRVEMSKARISDQGKRKLVMMTRNPNQSPPPRPFYTYAIPFPSPSRSPPVVPNCPASDLKAFERRLTEVITCLRPGTIRWRIILVVSTICTAIGAWQWLNDPFTSQVSFVDSLLNHPFFTLSSLILALLFLMGIHKRVVAPSIITARTRVVLADFNMSCDETGKLILKPRPANT